MTSSLKLCQRRIRPDFGRATKRDLSARPARPNSNGMRVVTVPSNTGNEPPRHPSAKAPRIGVLLVNLGTPEATDYWSMRRYLKEFLSDRRVIETSRLIWWPLLNLVILTRRPGPKGRDYASIWNKERNEGPLKTITRAQADKLKARLGEEGEPIIVDWAMRYGQPSTLERIEAVTREGCDRLLLVPLYPQYCAATTATACDRAFEA